MGGGGGGGWSEGGPVDREDAQANICSRFVLVFLL